MVVRYTVICSIRKIVIFPLNREILEDFIPVVEQFLRYFWLIPNDVAERMFCIVFKKQLPKQFFELLDYDVVACQWWLLTTLKQLEVINTPNVPLLNPTLKEYQVFFPPDEVLCHHLGCVRMFAQVNILRVDQKLNLGQVILLVVVHLLRRYSFLLLLSSLLAYRILDLLIQ